MLIEPDSRFAQLNKQHENDYCPPMLTME